MIYDSQDDLIRDIREHVANGGTVTLFVDPVTRTMGWVDDEHGKEWKFRVTDLKSGKTRRFGDLLSSGRGKAHVTASFNHGHGWHDVTCTHPECLKYVVDDVMLS